MPETGTIRENFARYAKGHGNVVIPVALLDSALDPARDGVIEDGVGCKYLAVPIPVSISTA
jgi:hypothetical protein